MKELLIALSLISVATERLTEMVKNVWDAGAVLGKWQYKLYVQAWAAVIGSCLTAYVQHHNPLLFPALLNNWFGCILIGLAICGGAGVLNSSTSMLETVSNELTILKNKTTSPKPEP